MEDPAKVSKSSIVTLRVINKENWRAITQLSVLETQQGNISANAMSLCESHYSEDAWVRAIYADDTPVGFLMLSIWPPEEWYYLWRFMIDHRYQRLGFGSAAVRLAIQHVRDNHPTAKMFGLCSTGPKGKFDVPGKVDVPAEQSPYYFYRGLGFKDISELDENGQLDMGVDL